MMPSLKEKNTFSKSTRRAFTLVELLVVISIIGVLAALLIPAVMGAQRRARSARIKLEIDSLDTAFEDYRNDVGGEYPPNANPATVNDVIRHFKKAFPRSREPESLIRQICGFDQGANSGLNSTMRPSDTEVHPGMHPAEAIVFWLGGFSSDPKYPISGPGGPSFVVGGRDNIEDRNRTFDFELSRLGLEGGISMQAGFEDPTLLRSIQYQANVNGNPHLRQINFWQYYPPKSTAPFVYFDTSRSIPELLEYDIATPANSLFPSGLAPLKRLEATVTDRSSAVIENLRYANENKFQILHAGIDEDWGDFTPIRIDFRKANLTTSLGSIPLLVPDGPFVAELGDTITNFDERTLQDAQP